jgi:hypothetical protein
MATRHLTLPEDIAAIAQSQALQAGYPDVQSYVADLIRADEAIPLSEELEKELMEGFNSPSRQLTPADWDRKRSELRRKYGSKSTG